MKNCILCGKRTIGSIGASGIRWEKICQPCKDREDNALKESLQYQAMVFDKVLED